MSQQGTTECVVTNSHKVVLTEILDSLEYVATKFLHEYFQLSGVQPQFYHAKVATGIIQKT
jgi:hypothetical protein